MNGCVRSSRHGLLPIVSMTSWVEFGNSLYQKTVDRYIAAEDIPQMQIEKAAPGWPKPSRF
jgi:hypothetical protein